MATVKKSLEQIERAISVVRTIKDLIDAERGRLERTATLDRFRWQIYMVAWVRFNEAERQLISAVTAEVMLHGKKGDVDKALFDLIAPFRSIGPGRLKRALRALHIKTPSGSDDHAEPGE